MLCMQKFKENLKQANKIKLLQFPKVYKHWNKGLQNIVWSEKKKQDLGGPDCHSKFWHDKRKNNCAY